MLLRIQQLNVRFVRVLYSFIRLILTLVYRMCICIGRHYTVHVAIRHICVYVVVTAVETTHECCTCVRLTTCVMSAHHTQATRSHRMHTCGNARPNLFTSCMFESLAWRRSLISAVWLYCVCVAVSMCRCVCVCAMVDAVAEVLPWSHLYARDQRSRWICEWNSFELIRFR